MQILDNLENVDFNRETILTIGSFDGVHRGHQFLIRGLRERAKQTYRCCGVITFYPHPRAVLDPTNNIKYLTTPGEKMVLLDKLEMDLLAILPFTPLLKEMPARDFIYKLYKKLHMRELWVGADFTVGRGRSGNVHSLRVMARLMGFYLRVIEPVHNGTEVISSTKIRQLLAQGEIAAAARLLGRPYSIAGEVVYGEQRGRTLGFPTANLEVRAERVTPPDGVYAVYCRVGEDMYSGVANIGLRPTFTYGQDVTRTIEAHLLDFSGNLYHTDLEVQFVRHLRAERRFSSKDELSAQIKLDIARARELLRSET